MPDWDEDSPALRANLRRVVGDIANGAFTRKPLGSAAAKRWHKEMMRGLTARKDEFVGAFRGERGVDIHVRVGARDAVRARDVASALVVFDATLGAAIESLDQRVVKGGAPRDTDTLEAVVDLCAWVHAEWVRIHPFVNGNGRTARLFANAVAMRYGLPPFVRLRPRPNDGYGSAAARAMAGDWKPTRDVFRELLDAVLRARR